LGEDRRAPNGKGEKKLRNRRIREPKVESLKSGPGLYSSRKKLHISKRREETTQQHLREGHELITLKEDTKSPTLGPQKTKLIKKGIERNAKIPRSESTIIGKPTRLQKRRDPPLQEKGNSPAQGLFRKKRNMKNKTT